MAFICAISCPKQVQGQCSAITSCLDVEDPLEYTVIESSVSNPLTFSFLIATGKLKDNVISLTTPQRLIVCGPIVANLIDYTFASGSEIIFVDNSSGLTVNANCKLVVKNTHVHGCTQLWRSIRVSGRLELVDGCKIEDGSYAVQLNQGSTFVSSQTEFDGNYLSIYAGASTPGAIVSFAGVTITGNTFVGSKPLLQAFTPAGTSDIYTVPNTGILAENV